MLLFLYPGYKYLKVISAVPNKQCIFKNVFGNKLNQRNSDAEIQKQKAGGMEDCPVCQSEMCDHRPDHSRIFSFIRSTKLCNYLPCLVQFFFFLSVSVHACIYAHKFRFVLSYLIFNEVYYAFITLPLLVSSMISLQHNGGLVNVYQVNTAVTYILHSLILFLNGCSLVSFCYMFIQIWQIESCI